MQGGYRSCGYRRVDYGSIQRVYSAGDRHCPIVSLPGHHSLQHLRYPWPQQRARYSTSSDQLGSFIPDGLIRRKRI